MLDVIILAIMWYSLVVLVITVLLNFKTGSLSDKYWYYLKIWYFIHLIPDFIIWYMYFFEDIPLPYRYGFTDLIKLWPFVSAFFSTLVTSGWSWFK